MRVFPVAGSWASTRPVADCSMMSSTLAAGAAPLRRREARRGIGEVDRPVGRHDDGVGIADWIVGRDAIGQHADAPVRRDGQQPLQGVRGNQASRHRSRSRGRARRCSRRLPAGRRPAPCAAACRLPSRRGACRPARSRRAPGRPRRRGRSCADRTGACSAQTRRSSRAASAPATTRALREPARSRDRRRPPPSPRSPKRPTGSSTPSNAPPQSLDCADWRWLQQSAIGRIIYPSSRPEPSAARRSGGTFLLRHRKKRSLDYAAPWAAPLGMTVTAVCRA